MAELLAGWVAAGWQLAGWLNSWLVLSDAS